MAVIVIALLLLKTSIGRHVLVVYVAIIGDTIYATFMALEWWRGRVDQIGAIFVVVAFVGLTGAIVDAWTRFHSKKEALIPDSAVVPNQSAAWANPPGLHDDRFNHG